MNQVTRSAVEIAADVRSGVLSAEAVVSEHLARIRELDPVIGAFQVVRADQALAEARAVDADPQRGELPLAGVPVAVKDNVAVSGVPLRNGSAATTDRPSSQDHEVVRRLRAAGAVVVGVTRVPEFCVWPFTDGPLGTARNPWDVSRTAGGSSGGSAAAVAAGMVPLAHGNDGLGSIRIPAACCGLVGIKPGSGLVPADLGRDAWFGMSENGVLATTVADAALGLAVLAGRHDLAELPEGGPGRLRVALVHRPPVPGVRLDPGWIVATRQIVGVLRGLGHQVDPVSIPAPPWVTRAVLSRWFAGTEVEARQEARQPSLLQPRTRMHARFGRLVHRQGWLRPEDRERWRASLDGQLSGYDVVLSPGLAAPPPAASGWAQRGWLANYRAATGYTGGLHPAWNLSGWPAICVPAGVHPTGTPTAVQLAARPEQEALLLALSRQIELQQPWSRRAPLNAWS